MKKREAEGNKRGWREGGWIGEWGRRGKRLWNRCIFSRFLCLLHVGRLSWQSHGERRKELERETLAERWKCWGEAAQDEEGDGTKKRNRKRRNIVGWEDAINSIRHWK